MRKNGMGRNALTVNEAAELLEVHPNTIYRLARTGVFRPTYDRRSRIPRPQFRREEVEAYAEGRFEKVSPQKTKLKAQQALARAGALERRIALLEDMLGARVETPHVDEESVIKTYAEADDDLDLPPVSPEHVLRWARFFIGVGEEFFDVLEAATDDENSWMVFHDLAQVMAENIPTSEIEVNPSFQAAYAYLEVGRRNLRAVLFTHLQSRMGLRRAMRSLGEVDDIHDEILSFASIEVASSKTRR